MEFGSGSGDGVEGEHIWVTFDLVVFKIILGHLVTL